MQTKNLQIKKIEFANFCVKMSLVLNYKNNLLFNSIFIKFIKYV